MYVVTNLARNLASKKGKNETYRLTHGVEILKILKKNTMCSELVCSRQRGVIIMFPLVL